MGNIPDMKLNLKVMKRALFLLLVVVAASPARAADDAAKHLQAGLFEEEANQNLPAAIEAYQAVVRQWEERRKLGATAVFRLGECYRKLGRTNDAVQQYQRILLEFSDQSALRVLSEQNLFALGVRPEQPARLATSVRPMTPLQNDLIQSEIDLAEKQLAEARKKVDMGVIAPSQAWIYEREVLHLKRQALLAQYTPEHPKVKELMQREIALQEQVVKEVQKRRENGRAAPGEELEQQRELLALKQEHARLLVPATDDAPYSTTDDEEKEVRRIQVLIQNSPDLINAPEGNWKSLLHKAAASGQLKVARFLLDHKAAVEGRDKTVRTPLAEAANGGHKAMVELLLDRGADANARDGNLITPLHLAAQRGFLSVMETLLAHKADANTKAKWDETPLHAAIQEGQKEAVVLILKNGADVEALKSYDISRSKPREVTFGTPLHLAVVERDPDMVALILKQKAKIESLDPEGQTPLHLAARYGVTDAAKLLLDAKANPNGMVDKGELRDWTPLNIVLGFSRSQGTLDQLLSHGADANLRNGSNAKNQPRMAPLGIAVEQGYLPLIEALLKYKADSNTTNAYNTDVPLIVAINRGRTDIVELLLDHGAKIETAISDGKPALTLAVLLDNLELTQLLLARGANPNLQTTDGTTALHYVVRDSINPIRNNRPGPNNEAIMVALLSHKADPNIRNHQGLSPLNQLGAPARPSTPLQLALTKMLLEHGAEDERPELSPNPDIIRVWRQGLTEGNEILHRSTNWNNRFTLAEALLQAYGVFPDLRTLPAPSNFPVGGFGNPALPRPIRYQPARPANIAGFEWPDLSRIGVRRLRPDKSYEHLEINLLTKSNTVDLSKSIPLEFGDVIEIPERLHALSEGPVGLTEAQARQLALEPPAKVSLRLVNGESTELALPEGPQRYLKPLLQSPAAQAVLRSNSDLSRIVVHRMNPNSDRRREHPINAAENRALYEDLLIENGDIIEVPDR